MAIVVWVLDDEIFGYGRTIEQAAEVAYKGLKQIIDDSVAALIVPEVTIDAEALISHAMGRGVTMEYNCTAASGEDPDGVFLQALDARIARDGVTAVVETLAAAVEAQSAPEPAPVEPTTPVTASEPAVESLVTEALTIEDVTNAVTSSESHVTTVVPIATVDAPDTTVDAPVEVLIVETAPKRSARKSRAKAKAKR